MAITALSDAELLDQARNGDEAAFTELYVRHQAAALRLARTYKRLGDPDDLVNGAFERVLGVLRRGSGPTESFRAYLFVTLRRLAAEQGERPADESLDEVPEPVSDEAEGPELGRADREMITQAFESLPDRWQAVLWHTAVEGRQPRELASVLGVSANAAAAMSYRAREKLRQAYLQAHLLASPAPDHEPYRSQLGAYVRDGLSKRDHDAVDRHLARCDPCTALVAELVDVNRMLVRSVVPLFVLAGAGKLAAGAAVGGAAAGGAAAGDSGKGFFGKLREIAPALGSTAVIAAVVAGIAGMGAIVAREDGGALNSAADAADIGATGPRDDGDAGRADGDSLFGDDDFAVSPFDDPTDDFGDFGDDFDFDDTPSRFGSTRPPSSRFGSNTPSTRQPGVSTPSPAPPSPGPAPVTPPGPGPGPGPTPASPPGPSPGPGPGPVPDPVPQPATLTFTGSAWVPTGVGTGTLSFDVGEAATTNLLAAELLSTRAGTGLPGLLASTVTLQASSQAAPLSLRVTLTEGATFPTAGLPAGCTSSSSSALECTFTQPAAGTAVPRFDLPVLLTAPGASASAEIVRGGAVEATLPTPVPLVQYESGLALTAPTWTPATSSSGAALPVGRAAFGVTNAGAHEVAGATITVTITGDAAFVPPDTDTGVGEALKAIRERLAPLGDWGAGFEGAFAEPITRPLPGQCTLANWTMPVPFDWAKALTNGLPLTIACDLGPIGPGATVPIADVTILGQPAFYDGDGKPEDGTATITLAIGDTPVGQPVYLTIPLTQPP